MERLAKRAIAASGGLGTGVVLALSVALLASAHGPSAGGPGLVPPTHATGHHPARAAGAPASGSGTQAPPTCDQGNHLDRGECVGHHNAGAHGPSHRHGSDPRGKAEGRHVG